MVFGGRDRLRLRRAHRLRLRRLPSSWRGRTVPRSLRLQRGDRHGSAARGGSLRPRRHRRRRREHRLLGARGRGVASRDSAGRSDRSSPALAAASAGWADRSSNSRAPLRPARTRYAPTRCHLRRVDPGDLGDGLKVELPVEAGEHVGLDRAQGQQLHVGTARLQDHVTRALLTRRGYHRAPPQMGCEIKCHRSRRPRPLPAAKRAAPASALATRLATAVRQLAGERRGKIERPLLVARTAIAVHRALGKTRQLGGERPRRRRGWSRAGRRGWRDRRRAPRRRRPACR